MNREEFVQLVRSLAALPKETEWVELKLNNADPQKIGDNISAVDRDERVRACYQHSCLLYVSDK